MEAKELGGGDVRHPPRCEVTSPGISFGEVV